MSTAQQTLAASPLELSVWRPVRNRDGTVWLCGDVDVMTWCCEKVCGFELHMAENRCRCACDGLHGFRSL